MPMTSITVKQVLTKKGGKTYSVTPETSVFNALALMAEHDIGAVLVMSGNKLLGIFTERDYARKIVLKGLDSRTATVGDMMTPDAYTIAPTELLSLVMNTMTKHRFRHLPVVESDQVVGIITIGDVVKAVMDEQEATIQQLSSYIAGDLAT